uniref:Transcription factor bHLH18-like isoform X1 n=2 Tax=Cicer arietinum TaxID=3827 RepID=A0A3Q7Y369_CICAR|nr:transcription factor bHLH18-like isoform X1 [Cicer arietinum]XP_027192441.1 transcription factor bHLH18-like isoform X1 [Cicer arietinum]
MTNFSFLSGLLTLGLLANNKNKNYNMTSIDESWTNWLCDTEPDDYSLINQLDTNTDNVSNLESSNLERPSKLLKKGSSSTYSYILSFENENPQPIKVEQALNPKTKVMNSKNEHKRVNIQEINKKNYSFTRSTTNHTPDHIIAERIRREKISQQFIALSALIPNLKKMDKASVLGDAIKYVKQLKDQVKVLEEQSKRKQSVESIVAVKKLSQLFVDEDVSDTSSYCCNGNSDETLKRNLLLPEVEARLSGKSVMIRILCEKDKVVMVNVYRAIEKFHLSVINASSFSFGSSVLAITIIAQMEDEFNISVQKLAKNLSIELEKLKEW